MEWMKENVKVVKCSFGDVKIKRLSYEEVQILPFEKYKLNANMKGKEIGNLEIDAGTAARIGLYKLSLGIVSPKELQDQKELGKLDPVDIELINKAYTELNSVAQDTEKK